MRRHALPCLSACECVRVRVGGGASFARVSYDGAEGGNIRTTKTNGQISGTDHI